MLLTFGTDLVCILLSLQVESEKYMDSVCNIQNKKEKKKSIYLFCLNNVANKALSIS